MEDRILQGYLTELQSAINEINSVLNEIPINLKGISQDRCVNNLEHITRSLSNIKNNIEKSYYEDIK